jgi:hypothetical protein
VCTTGPFLAFHGRGTASLRSTHSVGFVRMMHSVHVQQRVSSWQRRTSPAASGPTSGAHHSIIISQWLSPYPALTGPSLHDPSSSADKRCISLVLDSVYHLPVC